jgi:hypothetical protein
MDEEKERLYSREIMDIFNVIEVMILNRMVKIALRLTGLYTLTACTAVRAPKNCSRAAPFIQFSLRQRFLCP